jgi:DNA-binding beta-propeller fold protein YncE
MYRLVWDTTGDGTENGRMSGASWFALDGAFIFVLDKSKRRVQKFDLDGNFVKTWGSFGTGNGEFSIPTGIAADGDGHVFVLDHFIEEPGGRIQKFDRNGQYLSQWTTDAQILADNADGHLLGAFSIEVEVDGGHLAEGIRVERYSHQGSLSDGFTIAPEFAEDSYKPVGMAADGRGNLFISFDNFLPRNFPEVRKVTLGGEHLAKLDFPPDAPDGDSLTNDPEGLGVDAAGDLFVAASESEFDVGRIAKYSNAGAFLGYVKFDVTGPVPGNPHDVAVDGAGNLYVLSNDVLLKFAPPAGAARRQRAAGARDGRSKARRGKGRGRKERR